MDDVMHVEFCIDQRSLRRWHIRLVDQTSRMPGIAVGIRWAPPSQEPLPSCVEGLFSLERSLHGLAPGRAAPAEPADLALYVGEGGVAPDTVIDLSGGHPAAGLRRWRLVFDGMGGEAYALGALLAGRSPHVSVVDSRSGAPVASVRPRIESPHVIVTAFEEVLGRTAALIRSAIAGTGEDDGIAPESAGLSCASVAWLGTKALARTTLHRISGSRPPHQGADPGGAPG